MWIIMWTCTISLSLSVSLLSLHEGSVPQPMEEVRDGDIIEEDFEYEEDFEVSLWS